MTLLVQADRIGDKVEPNDPVSVLRICHSSQLTQISHRRCTSLREKREYTMLPTEKDEVRRVAVLRKLKLLDTPTHAGIDRITRHCADLFSTPFAQVSLLDKDRQWLLSSFGVELREIPREESFCHHAIAGGEPLMVEDALADVRFANNPLVTGEPHIRSYLGHPIRSPEGHFIGALCVADNRPRKFGPKDLARLECLARTAEDLIRAQGEFLESAKLNKLLRRETLALKKSSQLLKQAEKIGGIGAWELGLKSRTLQFSDQMYALSGLAAGEPIDTKRALGFYAEEDRPRINQAIRDAAITGAPFEYEADLFTADGCVRRIRCVGERLEGNENSSPRVVGVVRDISDAHHAILALKRAADYDSLTGIYNRHAFDRSLQEKIQEHRRTKQKVSLVLLDLDGFKDVNDTFGHVVGDVVLEELSARVLKVLGEDTVLARWGGDEFALLPPPGSSPMEVTSLTEAVLASIKGQVAISGQKLQLSGTAGVAWFEDGMSARELIRRADLALYEGKKRQRSAIHYYSLALENCNKARQWAIAEVRAALDEERVFAAYQPIVDLADGRVVGFESLMRLNTRAGGRLTATEVISAILDPILSREITKRMLRSLFAEIGTLQAARPGLSFVSVNVAEADLLSRGFAEKLLASLSEAGVPAQMVTLEITETMLLVNDKGTVRNVLTQLHDAGVGIALDDFGTGFSSLSHLRDFPIDKVKIDKSFVQAMTGDWQARTIVHALIAMAKNMGIQIIAEGIETDEQLQLLQQMGCGLGQGFLFSPAMDLGSVTLAGIGNSKRFQKVAQLAA
ncbi:putative bifunctional diguanylate cyclase/phosphodiesterase [Allopontixanthobacter sp.]|uniref:putative bifunctional diguanylate cyclase/phosphodiesterase n=1 Tax=Allopontixanthobacter sp. TaxID=2906452 RepID=UPI002AB9A125|nr:EAL domain-containing protein [Allopontixanthobacter sp.]MDZ4306953.1 EAL domain-containing protein [Allopontixanthobacter sp.]